MCEHIIFILIIIVSVLLIYFSLDPSRKVLKDGVIPLLHLPEKNLQRRILKPCVTNTSFCSSSGSELFTSASMQSEEAQKNKTKKCYKDFKEFCQRTCTFFEAAR